jgi:hypothetical protein
VVPIPITLAQASLNTVNNVDFRVIDNLRRSSWLWDHLIWDDNAMAGGDGTMVYAYNRLVSAASASPRNINEEYIPGKATFSQQTVNLKPFGGSFELDRVLRNLGPQATNQVQLQLAQLTKATVVRLEQEIVLGDTAVDSRGFDGLSKILTGTSTESLGATLDLSPAVLNSQVLAMAALDRLDAWLRTILPSIGSSDFSVPGAVPAGTRAILGNTVAIGRLAALARWASLYTVTTDQMDRQIESFNGWTLVDIGDRMDGSAPIIPIGAAVAGETDLYAVAFGEDALHGAILPGVPLIQTFLPNWSEPQAVKLTELEVGPLAVVLKNTKSAGAFRKVKVQ